MFYIRLRELHNFFTDSRADDAVTRDMLKFGLQYQARMLNAYRRYFGLE